MAKAYQTSSGYVRPLSGVVRALNQIEKDFNKEVKHRLGPEYRGVLRDYDYESSESHPIITGDLRDTTYFVILKGRGNNIVAAQSVLFEAELESEQDDSELKPGEEGTIEFAEKRGERAVQEYFYNQYMYVYEMLDDSGYFDEMFESARRRGGPPPIDRGAAKARAMGIRRHPEVRVRRHVRRKR